MNQPIENKPSQKWDIEILWVKFTAQVDYLWAANI